MAPSVDFSYSRNFVKLPRPLLRILLNDAAMLRVFLVCLDRARYAAGPEVREGKRIINLDVGQLVLGRKELAEVAGLTEDRARGALRRLESIGVITLRTTKLGTIVTLCRYDEIDDEVTRDSPTDSATLPQGTSNAAPSVPRLMPTNKKARRREGQEGRERGLSRPLDYSKVPAGMGGGS